MPRGRPPQRADLVQRLQGSTPAKHRLKVILQTLTWEKDVPRACAELGINASRFHALRNHTLQCLLRGLEPKPPGRPRRVLPAEQARISELEQQVQDLEIELRAAQVREEIAMLVPHLLRRRRTRAGKPASHDAAAPGITSGGGGKKANRMRSGEHAGPALTAPRPVPAADP